MELLYSIFSKYLDRENKEKPTSERGLVKNAPPEAVEAYEEFKKIEAKTDPDILI